MPGTLKVCLDPGHFGYTNCNKNVTPTYWESKTVWKLHLYLKEELEKYKDVIVVTTRKNEDKDMGLEARGKTSAGCDLFLSLHTNSYEDDESVDRATVIYQVKADQRMRNLAAAFGAAIKDTMGLSRYKTDLRWNTAHNADWYGVLRGAAFVNTPGLILEHGFHSHNATAKWLQNDANLRLLAKTDADVLAAEYGLRKKGSPFSDVPVDRWSYPYILRCCEEGIMSGIGGGKFSPEGKMTREQLAVVSCRLMEYADKKGGG